MIGLAMVGVLASIAIPAYNKQIEKSRNVEAIEAIDKIAQGVTAYYTANGHMPESAGLFTGFGGSGTFKFGFAFGPSWFSICQSKNGVAPQSDIELYFRTLAGIYVWDKLYFYPKGKVRFSYWYQGASDIDYAYARIEATRAHDCAAYKFLRYKLLLDRDEGGALKRRGPIIERD